jgi:hypothetical protein
MDDLQQLSNHEQEVLAAKMDRAAYYKHDECNLMQVRVFPLTKEEIFLGVRLGTLEAKFNLSKDDALDLAERLIYAAKYQSL